MKKDGQNIYIFIGLVVFVMFTIILLLNRNSITLSPWVDTGSISYVTYASGNDERIAVINNSEKAVAVLDRAEELVYKLDAKSHKQKIFSSAKFVELDEKNNLYVLDVYFGGSFNENVERVLKYSADGAFLKEIYTYHYTNVDFLTTKGKINGMAYFDDMIYLIRFEDNGFYLERTSSKNQDTVEVVEFFDYPNALRDLVYVHINIPNRRLSVTTKAGDIKQYGFDGILTYIHQADAEIQSLPWTSISDSEDNLIYADIISGEIVSIDTNTGEYRILYTASGEESPYYRINYTRGMIFASAYNETTSAAYAREDKYLREEKLEFVKINSYYYYSSIERYIQIALFVLLILDAIVLLFFVAMLIPFLIKLEIRGSLKTILFAGFCITFGSIMSAVLIINEMDNRYNQKAYNELENVSRLIAASVDIEMLTSLTSPSQFDTPEYLRLKDTIKNFFTQLQFKGELLYQIIWMEKGGIVYIMSDLENSTGIFFPFTEYEGSYYQKSIDSGEYVRLSNVTSEGRWVFTCGPIFNNKGEAIALIETGYDLRAVEEQTKAMILQTILIIIATSIAILLILIEFILILAAYKKNEVSQKQGLPQTFHPELLRALIFFLFVASNLATALLPMYASNLYQPLFNLPREFIITLPFTTDVIFAALALLIIPNVLEKVGIKWIGLMAAICIVVGNVLCFIATNTIHLAIAYALTGFASGTLILIINTIIGAQKNVEEINSGFAHFNASYLAGVNVGVVFGSILAQFFSYRIVYLFSSMVAVALLCIYIFSVRSQLVSHIYDIIYVKSEKKDKFALVKFIFKPIVLGSLLLLLLPYVASMSFTNYFMPIFGTDNGLRESNIGQLILLSGLFAILFGTSLCEYVSRKIPLKAIIFVSLLGNALAIYLFSLNVSIPMLIVTVSILAIANIFTLTNIQTYFATLYHDTNVPSMQALSIYSAVENISMAIGPLVFSYVLANNIVFNMRLFAVALLICLVLFFVISGFSGGRKTKGSSV
jgi:predicted MFS family arabinose efflux permease